MALTLLILGAGVVWLLRAWLAPFKDCPRCNGGKVNAFTRAFGLRKRRGACGKCGGSGQVQVLGARRVHKAVRALRSARGSRKKD